MADYIIKIEKEKYSEEVVRRALYWLSERCVWVLDEESIHWRIELQGDAGNDEEGHLFKLLNDQVLREKIDQRTGGLRLSIIQKVLSDMDKSL